MYKKFHVRNYKCLYDLELRDLERFNLIVGKNNVGKTNLLEALFIHSSQRNVTNLLSPFSIRPLSNPISGFFWQYLFSSADTSKPIVLSGETENQVWNIEITEEEAILSKDFRWVMDQFKVPDAISRVLKIRLRFQDIKTKKVVEDEYLMTVEPTIHNPLLNKPPVPSNFNSVFIPHYPVNEWRQWFWSNLSNVFKSKKEAKLAEALRVVEPELTDILLAGNELYVGLEGMPVRIPINQVGNGLIVVLMRVLAVLENQKGVVLIDEFENGLHYSILGQVWKTLKDLARNFDVQILATTHSFECVRAAYDVFSNDEVFDFSLYRLELVEKKNQVIRYDKESFQISVEQNIEVR